MREQNIHISLRLYQEEELNTDDLELLEAARQATYRSYAPYSHFSVGAAARLANGTIVTGSNQENAAYPSGLCAERTALFYANAQYPDQAIPPCGACRQVMLEAEQRFQRPMRILLFGTKGIYEVKDAGSLLPLSFDASAMK